VITYVREMLANFTTERPWIPEKDREKLANMTAEVEEWMMNVTTKQDALAPHEPPAFLCDELRTQLAKVSKYSTQLLKRPKPKEDKPKETKKKDKKKKKKNATATDNTTDEAEETAEETPEGEQAEKEEVTVEGEEKAEGEVEQEEVEEGEGDAETAGDKVDAEGEQAKEEL
jgi:hypothetical protein